MSKSIAASAEKKRYISRAERARNQLRYEKAMDAKREAWRKEGLRRARAKARLIREGRWPVVPAAYERR
ncbi:hypothetical protein W97_01065 [Coniosporium apollinis CBS 100218]|uniref:Uncharacterized protein n=1 Tax=Coniosporium apollinis (strain CBS 100218) TaxID=1168221 RepID=R7YIU8_CONA1|nr:uncharacterized protein W97_01065 [Coniosporium apollinis CBS 100218]EON61847.1 hypothetical protein W97_01065 [Coniosporium apollinis CBS 100218]